MECSKCKVINSQSSAFCSACGSKLTTRSKKPDQTASVPLGSEVTINVYEKNKKTTIGCFGFILIVLFIAFLVNACSGPSSNNSSSQPSQSSAQPTNTFCPLLIRDLNQAVKYMGNAGTLYTAGDVAEVLKDKGTSLASGFDLNMAGSPERLLAIQNAGNQLLKIRVNLLDGGDITPAAESFMESFNFIRASCK